MNESISPSNEQHPFVQNDFSGTEPILELSGTAATSEETGQQMFIANQARFDKYIQQRQAAGDVSPTLHIPDGLLTAFVPSKVYEIATNPENLKVVIAKTESGEESDSLQVLIAEKDYGQSLTDPEAYEQWKIDKAAAASQSRIKLKPPAPAVVDRLHAEYSSLVDAGQLLLTDRVLFEFSARQNYRAPEALYVSHFDGETGAGIATDFYTNNLPELARALGFRFITGANNSSNIDYFTQKLGRSLGSELTPAHFQEVFPGYTQSTDDLTIDFLYPEDKAAYLQHSEQLGNAA